VALADLAGHRGESVRVGGAGTGIDGTLITLADSSGIATLELQGAAAPLAATLHDGDLLNASGTVSADGRRVIVNDPRAITRGAGVALAPAQTQTGHPAADLPPAHEQSAAGPPQIAPIVAFLAILGLTAALVIGAIAFKLGWPNRVQKWANRLKAQKPRI
jgi:hypothetical protein